MDFKYVNKLVTCPQQFENNWLSGIFPEVKCSDIKSTAGLFFTPVSTMKVCLDLSAEVSDKGRSDACKWFSITTYHCWSQTCSNNCTMSNTNPGKMISEGDC